MGIINKIKTLKAVWNGTNLKNNLVFLMQNDLQQRELDQRYQIKDELIEECVCEFEEYKSKYEQLNVLDSVSTINILMSYPKSFTRYGDGEIHIMQGKDQPFQKYDPLLAEKMKHILGTKREDVYVGLNQAYFQSPQNFTERNRKFYRLYGTGYRRFFTEHCVKDSVYLDASCFGAYYRFGDEYDFEGHYDRIKQLFADKKIAIISGEGVIEKLEYDVFERATDKMILHGPRIHAFSEYDSLLKKINETIPKDYLVCIILGQTATVLVPDLTDMGYMAWDVGHVAKDYDAYMKKTEKTQQNMDDFWAPD